MTNQLSICQKQALSKDSNAGIDWADLDSKDRNLVMAVCFANTVEDARKKLGLSIGGFYKRWKYLKPMYNALLDDLPNQAVTLLKASSKLAADTLVKNLEATSSSDQIKAANSILDRVTPEREEIQKGSYRKITLEEFINQT